MPTFTAFNAAGMGFNMTSTGSSGWSFTVTDPSVSMWLAYDNGSTAIYDVNGSAFVDEMKVKYWEVRYGVIAQSLVYKNNGAPVFAITGLSMFTSLDELASNVGFVNITGGRDTFHGNDYVDVIRAGNGNDKVYGYGGADMLFGDAGSDILSGHSGKDDLYGGSGRDRLNGGSDSDYLSGGAGNDTLSGGSGEDYFAFDAPLSLNNVDVVTDFRPSDDTIMLDAQIFTAFGFEGWILADEFVVGSRAQDSSDRIIYNRETGALLYDPDGAGGLAAIRFAQLARGLSLTANDFYVF